MWTSARTRTVLSTRASEPAFTSRCYVTAECAAWTRLNAELLKTTFQRTSWYRRQPDVDCVAICTCFTRVNIEIGAYTERDFRFAPLIVKTVGTVTSRRFLQLGTWAPNCGGPVTDEGSRSKSVSDRQSVTSVKSSMHRITMNHIST